MKIYGNDGNLIFCDQDIELIDQNSNYIEVKLENGEVYLVEIDGSNANEVYASNVICKSTPPVNIGGLMYKTVRIGKQVWMAENLQLQTTGSAFYNNDEATHGRNGKNYGRLYSWNDASTIVVPGWHLPTIEEYTELLKTAGYTPSGAVCDGAQDFRSVDMWQANPGNDKFGFCLKPAGYGSTKESGVFGGETQNTYLWSSTENPSKAGEAYAIATAHASYKFSIPASYNKTFLRSVRLIKD